MKPFLQNKRILFIRLRLLGDIIFTIPALQIFKHHFPHIKTYYVVEEEFREIGRMLPGVDHVIVIPRKMNLKQMWAFRKDIKKLEIETVVDFHGGPKSAQLTRLTGAKLRIGYETPFRNWAYTQLIPRKIGDAHIHSVYNQARLLEHLDIPITPDMLPPYPEITIDKKQVSKEIIEVLKKKKKVVIHVGAGNMFRDWGLESFSALIYRLKRHGIDVFLVGSGEEEKVKGRYLSGMLGAEDFIGKLSIPELIYLVANSDVYMGADSGPLHAASLTRTPLVALYGPNIPEISGLWRKEKVTIIRHPMACQPCNQKKCIHGIIPCMKNITTDEVYEAINRYLQ